MSAFLDAVIHADDENLTDQSEFTSDGDNFEDDDDASDEEVANSTEPRKPRRAEIDPETMSEEDRESMRQRVIAQVEFYFGDAHYPKDQLMIDHAKLDAEGYIDIQVVMTFKKMRRLTQFAKFAAEALRGSEVVGVNEEGSKLRRKQPVRRPSSSTYFIDASFLCRCPKTWRMD